MECVLSGVSGEHCLIYLDDIIVFSTTFQEHIQRFDNPFTLLKGLKDTGGHITRWIMLLQQFTFDIKYK